MKQGQGGEELMRKYDVYRPILRRKPEDIN